MAKEFDPGYYDEPIKSLVQHHPGADVYPASDFRVEWGPIFHRGRLDGSAVVLVIGQDPATNETIVRRILVGTAGQRAQGFLAKLGVTRSYVMVNAFLYSVYGQKGGEKHRHDPKIAAYRNQWLDALLIGKSVQAVVAFGSLADSAWNAYRLTPNGQTVNVAYRHVRHPTYPESSSGGNAAKAAAATKAMLAQWNLALVGLRGAITRPDVSGPFIPYGDAFAADELVDVPDCDVPAGLPEWMRTADNWSRREGSDAAAKRATLVVQVPIAYVGGSPAPHLPVPDGVMHAVTEPVDPPTEGRLALRGRVVTMDSARRVLPDAVVYVDRGVIVALRAPTDPAPAGFAEVARLETRGTIYPGLIELHNHLPYNVLQLWNVPKKYSDRNVWRRSKEYHAAVVAPMSVLAAERGLAASIARYVECKTLLAGVTTSQGITLINSGVTSKFRGLVRNVERTDESVLPEVATNVSDVGDLKDGVEEFSRKLVRVASRGGCLLHHLSEGTDARSRGHFAALRRTNGEWALSAAMAGIHATALDVADLDVLAQHGSSIVWSPLSNLLLYGRTTSVRAARERGIRIALGSDWSPSGSKNLLGELKAARAASDTFDLGLSDLDLVDMVTSTAASVIRWERQLGSIEPGKKADLLVLGGKDGPASGVYTQLVRARETDVALVIINGVQRYGKATLMKGATGSLEPVVVGGRKRQLLLDHPATPLPHVTLAESRRRLSEAMQNLPALAKAQESAPHRASVPAFTIALDELASPPTPLAMAKPAAPLSASVSPLVLDPLTVCDDPSFGPAVAGQLNISADFKAGLAALYAS